MAAACLRGDRAGADPAGAAAVLASAPAGRARHGVGLGGAVVYAEKNWGPRFTEHWWWGQAQAFEGTDACVAFAGGRVLGGAPTGVVVRVEDRVLRLAPPFAALRTAIGDGAWRVRARSARWEVDSRERPPARRPSCRSRCPASAGSPTAPSSTSPAASARPSSGPGACGGAGSRRSRGSSAGCRSGERQRRLGRERGTIRRSRRARRRCGSTLCTHTVQNVDLALARLEIDETVATQPLPSRS